MQKGTSRHESLQQRQEIVRSYILDGTRVASGLYVVSRRREDIASALGVSGAVINQIGDAEDPRGIVASAISQLDQGEVIADGLVVRRPDNPVRSAIDETHPDERMELIFEVFDTLTRDEQAACYRAISGVLGHNEPIGD